MRRNIFDIYVWFEKVIDYGLFLEARKISKKYISDETLGSIAEIALLRNVFCAYKDDRILCLAIKRLLVDQMYIINALNLLEELTTSDFLLVILLIIIGIFCKNWRVQ